MMQINFVAPTTNMDSAAIIVLCLIPPIAGGMYCLSAWIHYRQINRDAPLSAYQRQLTKYLAWFVIGMGYGMVFTVIFHWPRPLWILIAASWGFVLWTAYRKKRLRRRQDLPNAPLG